MSKSCWLSRPHAVACVGGVLFAAGVAAPAGADRLMLLSGETIEVTDLQVSETAVRFSHPVLGEMELPRDQVRGIDADRAPGRFEQQAALGALQDDAAAPVEVSDPEWTGGVTLALTGTSGNSESFGFVGIATARRETDRVITNLDTGYFLSSSNGDRSESRFTLGGEHKWLMPESKWNIFADARYDYDEFQSWEHRVNAHVGPGYQLVDRDDYKVGLKAGIGFVKEFNSPNDDLRAEALLGAEGEWKISEKQSLAWNATLYPDLDDGGEFRTIENLAWKLELDEATNMSLSAGLQHEYQSQVAAGRDKNDLRVYIGLNFSF